MRNDLSMREMNNPGGIAGLGRGEDTMLAHVAPGEMVVPPVITPETQKIIEQEMMAVGLNPNEYRVGDGMSINPITGMAEFGFLKKLGKSLKKVVKKVAPIALPLLIPGVGGALSGALGSVGSAIGTGMSRVGLGGLASTLGNVGSTILNTAGTIRGGIGGLLGMGGGQQDEYSQLVGGEDLFDPNYGTQQSSSNLVRRLLGSTPGQSGIGGIEDFIKGRESDFSKERGEAGGLRGMLPDNSGLMAMAALYGKAVKDSQKERMGGLSDIRTSIRPDLMPQPTYQGFDLGVRAAAEGGLMENELDLRMGGPSIGPGTGTSDDIPAMLSDGEFVMTSAANNGLGGFKVTKSETGIEIMPKGKPDRQQGARNMDRLMKMFEQYNEIGKV